MGIMINHWEIAKCYIYIFVRIIVVDSPKSYDLSNHRFLVQLWCQIRVYFVTLIA